jgi:hypothetical protein
MYHCHCNKLCYDYDYDKWIESVLDFRLGCAVDFISFSNGSDCRERYSR